MRFLSTVLASIIGGLVAIGIFAVFILIVFAGIAAMDTGRPVVHDGSVLTVRLRGHIPEISETAPVQFLLGERPVITLRELTRAIRYAADDRRIHGLLIIPESAGGSWAALEEIRSAVLAFRESGKPTVATSTADGFSERGYFVASAAEQIYSPEMGGFELNGFALIAQFLKGLMDMVGVRVEAVRAGRFKSAVEPFTREHASDEYKEQLQDLVDSQEETFLSAVADGRGIDYESLRGMVESAGVTDAEDALAAGLLDGLLTENEVMVLFADSLLTDLADPQFVAAFDYARALPAIVGNGPSESVVAVVYAVGTIVEGDGGSDPDPLFGGRRVGSRDLIEALREIDEDNRVKAVVLRIDSPGGSGAASDVVYRAVEQTASIKPVIASFGGVAASGGYFIAAGADSIVADASTITGSIGVFSLAVDVSDLLNDKLGITFDAVKTAPSADMFSGLRALTPFERRILETGVDRMYDRFTKVVAQGRGLRMSEVLALAEGRAWSGRQASTNGLVDRMGTLDDAIDMAARAAAVDSAGYRIRIYPREKTLLERLWQFASTTESRALGDAFDGSVMSPAVRQIRLLDELERMHGSVEARLPMSISIE